MKTITVYNYDLEIPFTEETSVLDLLIKNEVNIDHSCGGQGSCGTCRVLVRSNLSALPNRNEIENERATDLSFNENERLSCQLCPLENLIIEIP